MNRGEEVITLEITKEAFERLYNFGLVLLDSADFKIKKVEPYKEEYKDNPVWVKLKKESDESYKKLKEYEFQLRHGK
jgi:hypothetical protein